MIGVWSLRLIAVAVLLAVAAIVLFRSGAVAFSWPLLGIALASLIAAVALVLGIIALIMGGRASFTMLSPALAGSLLAALFLVWPLLHLRYALSVPPIHDISTQPTTPPPFEAIVALRAKGTNSLAPLAETARLQQEHYTNVQPAQLRVAPQRAFALAEDEARARGWELVQVAPQRGRIEAVATSRLFGFKDDVLILIEPHRDGAVVQMRSASRVGRSDLGQNARRISSYLDALAARQ